MLENQLERIAQNVINLSLYIR